jgi:hypothetical protein
VLTLPCCPQAVLVRRVRNCKPVLGKALERTPSMRLVRAFLGELQLALMIALKCRKPALPSCEGLRSGSAAKVRDP